MTRVFLAAGVAALAIAAPASAGPHGGGKGGQPALVNHGNGGGNQRHGGGGGGFAGPRVQQQHAPRMTQQRAQQRAPRMQQQRFASMERPQHQMQAHQQRGGHGQARMAAQQQTRGGHGQAQHQQRVASRQQMRNDHAQAQARQQQAQNRQQMRANRAEQAQQMRANRVQQAQQMRGNRMQQAQDRMAQRQQLRAERMNVVQNHLPANQQFAGRNAVGYGVGGCPPGLASKGCMPPGQAMLQGLRAMPVQNRVATLRDMGDARYAMVDFAPQRQILAPAVASALIGMPLTTAASFGTFSPFPQSLGYLYPSTPNYYYQYGNGYAYQIDRGSNLIAALIPLLAGGYYAGSYLPQAYMSSYVPNYYGLNSFYPANYSYGGYGGYGGYYDNLCNRYAYGVVYQVDCMTGMVQNVIPTYAGGYGVGQMLPSSYSYYNVPYQYRSMYYDTPDYGYWYAPGAIYQYDRGTSLITSVAALMSPGFTVGQALPAGYGMYNVPLAYRATYYDTPNAWYRYNNGYIYQVDPTTQLVTAIVASLLT